MLQAVSVYACWLLAVRGRWCWREGAVEKGRRWRWGGAVNADGGEWPVEPVRDHAPHEAL